MANLNYEFKPVEKTVLNVKLGDKNFQIDVTQKCTNVKLYQELIKELQSILPKLEGQVADEAFKEFSNLFDRLLNSVFNPEQIKYLWDFYSDSLPDLFINVVKFFTEGFFPAIKIETERLTDRKLEDL